MAKIPGKKGYRLRFELSVAGLLGLVMVAFCIFLWMFLLGVWAGQAILPPESSRSTPSLADFSERWQRNSDQAPPQQQETFLAPEMPADRPAAVATESGYGEASFFSLQVGAYSESTRAERTLASWLQRGFEAFLLQPEEGGDALYRVCVGRFENLVDANQEAGRLEESDGIKPFITLIAAGRP
jgi:cell division protein FtsN